MCPKEYTLVQMIRDPVPWVYEVSELEGAGHYTLYRYDARDGLFYRATVPEGAGEIQFFRLGPGSKVPLYGWQAVLRRLPPRGRPRLIPDPGTGK